jgi:hypothetical protein
MAQTKKLDQERWSEFLSMFSNGNRGRMVAVEVADMDIGDQPLTDGAPLFAIDYDPANKGDDLVITTGRDKVDYSHKINAPAEIWELQDDNGKVVSLEVIDRSGGKTILVFKS